MDETDMAAPVTRGEMREEFARFEERIERKFDHKLEMWGGALLEEIKAVRAEIGASERRLTAEFARQARAILETSAAS
jgi:hypothetical protein